MFKLIRDLFQLTASKMRTSSMMERSTSATYAKQDACMLVRVCKEETQECFIKLFLSFVVYIPGSKAIIAGKNFRKDHPMWEEAEYYRKFHLVYNVPFRINQYRSLKLQDGIK